jgi:glycosyltransferase involved in cell wall biosynthesis
LAEQEGLEAKVVLLSETEANRKWEVKGSITKFNWHVLPGIHWFIAAHELHVHLNWGLRHVIKQFRPHVLITSGYDNLAYWIALFYAKAFHKPLILWFESSLLSARYKTGLMAYTKRFFVRQAAAYIAFGTKAAECLVELGAEPNKVFIGPNTVDMEWFRKRTIEIRQQSSFTVERSRYPPVMLLYVGQLIECKNVGFLLEALKEIHDPSLGLLIVGSGPLEQELMSLCSTLQVPNVYFVGFKQQDELPLYYALADIFILPSTREVWGLVVNEALASGLYVLCSNRAGAAYDLIEEGWNGRIFDPYDIDQLVDLICETKVQIHEIRARREAISDHACKEFSIERSAQAFVDAIQAVMGERA